MWGGCVKVAGVNGSPVFLEYSKEYTDSYSHDKTEGHGASHGKSHEYGY